MTHYLRNDGMTIVDLESSPKDLRCVIDIKGFSNLLLLTPPENQYSLINDFDWLQEIRGEWFEGYSDDLDITPRRFATERLKEIAKKWNLQYVED